MSCNAGVPCVFGYHFSTLGKRNIPSSRPSLVRVSGAVPTNDHGRVTVEPEREPQNSIIAFEGRTQTDVPGTLDQRNRTPRADGMDWRPSAHRGQPGETPSL
jgi:hypothetical protein